MARIAMRERDRDGLDDAELAHRAAAGDDAAFAALFSRHFERLRRVCLLCGASDHDAADAAQLAFCHAWRGLKARREDGNVRAWLDAIVRNELRGIQRRTHQTEMLDEALTASGPQPDQIVQSRAELREILGDIRALPDGQRTAISLQLQGHLDDRSLAAALGTAPATARRAVADARSSLTDMRNGRMLSCQSVRERIDDDRRTLRTREITAHLKACPSCETYAHTRSRRRERQTLLAIPALIGRLAHRARRLASRHLGGHSGSWLAKTGWTAKALLTLGAIAAASAIATVHIAPRPNHQVRTKLPLLVMKTIAHHHHHQARPTDPFTKHKAKRAPTAKAHRHVANLSKTAVTHHHRKFAAYHAPTLATIHSPTAPTTPVQTRSPQAPQPALPPVGPVVTALTGHVASAVSSLQTQGAITTITSSLPIPPIPAS